MNDKPIKLILNLAKVKLTIVSDARVSQAFDSWKHTKDLPENCKNARHGTLQFATKPGKVN
jgi:hypothetical protein